MQLYRHICSACNKKLQTIQTKNKYVLVWFVQWIGVVPLNFLMFFLDKWNIWLFITKVHLYWFMKNWWPGCLFGRTYMYLCTGSIHMRTRGIVHTVIPTSIQLVLLYLLCLLPLLLSFFFPFHSPPSLLPSPPSHLSLPFFPHTYLHSYLFYVQDHGVH